MPILTKKHFAKTINLDTSMKKNKPNNLLKPIIYYTEIDNIEFKQINEIDDSIETIYT